MRHSAEKLWTAEDVADFCQVKPSVVRYWVRNGEIPHIRLGRQVRFDSQAVKEWVLEKNASPNLNIRNILNRID